MQITTKGQVTIPNEFRKKYGLLPHVEVEFKEVEGHLCLVKAKPKKSSRGISIINRMRSAKIDKRMTTDQIMELTRGYEKDDK